MKRAAIFKYAERKAEHFGSAINLKFMNINIFLAVIPGRPTRGEFKK